MSYKVNERDIAFTLFDYLQIHEIPAPEMTALSQEDCQAILGEALKFAQKEIAPLNKVADSESCRFENNRVHTPSGFKEAYQRFAASGFIAMDVPTTYGGQGLPIALTTAVNEFFIGASVAFSMYPGLSRGAAHLIETFASEELAKLFVPKVYSGQWAGTMCLTESQAGSAVGDLTTTASPEGDHYKIKGSKIFISSGDHDLTENIVHMVLARIEGDPAGTKGISLFVVPKIRVNADGSLAQPNDVKTVNIEHKMGIKGSSTCTLTFGDNGDCIGYLVGQRARGMAMMFQMMNEARIACGLQGQATAAVAYEHALEYAKERTQGGRTPIVEYPDVRRMLITMKAYVEGMRALLLYSAALQDRERGAADGSEAQKYADRMGLLTPICKAYCTDMGFRVTELAMQTYGGYGYSSEYPIEQYMRDIKISSIYEGTNGIQALDLIGRKLPQKNGQAFRDLYEEVNDFCARHAEHAAFASEVAALKKSWDQLAQVTMKFAEWGMSGQMQRPALHAVPYLYSFGDALLAYLWLDQARLALQKLEALWGAHQANDESAKAQLCTENEEARFFESKVKTARFFIHQLLPQLTARSKAILSDDLSALKIRF